MPVMKKLLVLAVVAAVAAAVPAFAGDCGSSDCGFDCSNMCPLAKDANTRRSAGAESFAVSPAVRATLTAAVQRNLARV
jgi:hypothetical protein